MYIRRVKLTYGFSVDVTLDIAGCTVVVVRYQVAMEGRRDEGVFEGGEDQQNIQHVQEQSRQVRTFSYF